jgi:thioesterase domain-containing protein
MDHSHQSPATHTEAVLTSLYAAVLHREQVGATDSFFDIGGSSLQVMRLIDLISQEIGADVGVTTVFLHPSPRQLAASIDAIRSGAAGSADQGPVVELSAGPGKLPLFLIHAVGGTVSAYPQLAGELAGTFKVFGIQAPGLAGAGGTAASLAELVADYSERIRAAQPDGPYRLAGWSMGGVVAFEIARRLELARAPVSLLVLLDAPFAIPDTGAGEAELAGQFVADAAYSLGWDPAGLPDAAVCSAEGQLSWLADRLAGADVSGGSGGGGGAVAERLRQRFEVFQAHVRMLAGYQPAAAGTNGQVRAPALVISADGSPNAPTRDYWPGVLGGPVRVLPVDSDHYTFLRPPLAAEVATSILKWQAGFE